ncbi:MAG TPA: hypothetical protein DEG43_07760 [Acidimicrobiaceae bacterium]|nr:hypothetical protein [Acidimicrobiaceae bacterium]
MTTFLALFRLEIVLAKRLAPLRIVMALLPIVMMIFLANAVEFLVHLDGYLRSNGTEHGIAGLSVLFCFVNLPFLSWSTYDEHGFGTWDRLRSSHVPPSLILASKVAFMTMYLIFMFGVSYLGGLLLDMDIKGSLGAWALIALMISFTASCYGIMLYVLLPTANLFVILSHAGCLLMGGFAGCLVPFRLLPGWVQNIAPALPQYWATRAFREVSLDGLGLGAVVSELAILGCFSLLFLVVAAWRFDPSASKRPLSE